MGSAAPVNLPFQMHALGGATLADAAAPRGRAEADRLAAARDAQPNADHRQHSARFLKIGRDGDLPCDSSEWATSGLFGPHAALAAVLGVRPNGIGNGARESAFAKAMGDRPSTADAGSSAFGSVFGNLPQSAFGGGPAAGAGASTGGTGTGGGVGAAGGTGGGTVTGAGPTIGGGPVTGGGPFTGGGTGSPAGPGKDGGTGGGIGGNADGGTGGGADLGSGSDPGSAGGPTDGSGSWPGTGGTGTGGSPTQVGGDAGSADGVDGGVAAGGGVTAGPPEGSGLTPVEAILPNNAGSKDHPGGDPVGGGSPSRPDTPGAVPEPASWATMLFGFGLIGGIMRARRPVNAAAA